MAQLLDVNINFSWENICTVPASTVRMSLREEQTKNKNTAIYILTPSPGIIPGEGGPGQVSYPARTSQYPQKDIVLK